MKNIVIFGAGVPNKFGYDFVEKSRIEGHNVTVFSHTDHGLNNPQNIVIDYSNYNECDKKFDDFILNNKQPIDIIFFNHTGGYYPSFVKDPYAKPNLELYSSTLNTQVVIPHLFISKTINLMSDKSKTVFSTNSSGMSLNYRMGTEKLVGFVGANTWKINMMFGYANAREKNITYCCISPSINYENPEIFKRYKEQDFNLLYNFIHNYDDSFNGKIVTFWGHNKLYTLNLDVGLL